MEYIARLCRYDGVSQLVSELAYYYGVKREILFPATHPNHREMVSDDMTSKQAIIQAASNLGRTVPVFSCFWLQQRNFVLVSKVIVIYAFGILHRNDREAKRSIGWTIQMALDQEKEVFCLTIFLKDGIHGRRFTKWIHHLLVWTRSLSLYRVQYRQNFNQTVQ